MNINEYSKKCRIALLLFSFYSCSATAHVGVDLRIEKYNRLITQQPGLGNLYLKRGELHRENQHWHQAWADFEKAQQLSDSAQQQMEILFCMGRMKREAGLPEQAIPLLKKVVAKNPDYKIARLNLARSYFALKKTDLAVAEMNRFMALIERPAPDYYLERAKMTRTMGSSGYDPAIQGLDEGIETLGPIVSLIQYTVALHLSEGETEQAIKRIQQLPEAIRQLPKWQSQIGDSYAQAGNQKMAEQFYQSAWRKLQQLPQRRRSTRAMKALDQYLSAKLNFSSSSPTNGADNS